VLHYGTNGRLQNNREGSELMIKKDIDVHGRVSGQRVLALFLRFDIWIWASRQTLCRGVWQIKTRPSRKPEQVKKSSEIQYPGFWTACVERDYLTIICFGMRILHLTFCADDL
jgi:hypothetical protein